MDLKIQFLNLLLNCGFTNLCKSTYLEIAVLKIIVKIVKAMYLQTYVST